MRARQRLLTSFITAGAAVAAVACASAKPPATFQQARDLMQRLSQEGADQRVSGEMLRAREALGTVQTALDQNANQEYLNGLSNIALRTVQTAEAANARVLAERAGDSLRTVRLNRLLAMTQAQRDAMAAQNQLSQQEISTLRERNVQVSQRAESLRVTSDSLRRAAEETNARLNQAMTQLRSLVQEITNLQETSRGLVISLSDILFDVNRATLKSGAEANIRRIAAVLQQYPEHQISVEGHTDNTGTHVYNQRLSEQRAASVREALVRGGVDPSRITAKGFGETQPVATNDTPAGRQQNRRVEVVVLGAGTVADAVRARGDSARRDSTTRQDSSRAHPPE
jgi:outer membrane protein OmpA-like peptidoglycan-associated protein